jgi:hypothetical protein
MPVQVCVAISRDSAGDRTDRDLRPALSSGSYRLVMPVVAAVLADGEAEGSIKRTDPLLWAIYSIAYLIYALLRGSMDGKYPYPFIDVDRLGGFRILVNSAAIGIGFLLAGSGSITRSQGDLPSANAVSYLNEKPAPQRPGGCHIFQLNGQTTLPSGARRRPECC